jgi:hypothetical protein
MARTATGTVAAQKSTLLSDVGVSHGEWLKFPNSVHAPSPFDRKVLCRLKISHNDTRKAARAGRRQPAFDLWSIVLGYPPPVPGVGARNDLIPGALTSIAEAHACFRGIQRPLAEDDDGRDVIAYILRPRFFYEYDPNMVSVALKVPVPRDVIFVVYARLSKADDVATAGPVGVITHWGFVEADSANPKLPVKYSSRYRTQLW